VLRSAANIEATARRQIGLCCGMVMFPALTLPAAFRQHQMDLFWPRAKQV
jgi:hypothetical protein